MARQGMVADEPGVDELEGRRARRPGFFVRLLRTLVLIVVLLALILGGVGLYNQQQATGRMPWEWGGAEWSEWWATTTSLGRQVGTDVVQKGREAGQKAVEYGGQAVESVKSVEWSKIGDRISNRTKELFGRSDQVVQQIDQQKKQVKTDDGGYAPQFSGPAGEQYDFGLQSLSEGIKFWQVSVKDSQNEQVLNPRATERARKFFQKAVANLEEAKRLDPTLPNLDTFLQQARDYLADSTERQQKIEELLRTQQGGAAPAQGAVPAEAAGGQGSEGGAAPQEGSTAPAGDTGAATPAAGGSPR